MALHATTRPCLSTAAVLAASLTAGCAGPMATTAEAPGPLRAETVWAVTDAAELVRFNAGQPQRLLDRKPLQGLPAGERLLGLDYRVAKGVLFTLSSGGRLYTLNTATGQLNPVGNATPVALKGGAYGVDFNPVADRVRVVSDAGLNLRLHPDNGALAATDPPPAYAVGDARFGQPARLAAAGYTYNKTNDKLTTNYAIDLAGVLVTQGTHETVQPAVSPNTGQLFTVGPMGTGTVEDAALDIDDVRNQALAALRQNGRTRLFALNLASGQATAIGTVGDGRALWGMAVEP